MLCRVMLACTSAYTYVHVIHDSEHVSIHGSMFLVIKSPGTRSEVLACPPCSQTDHELVSSSKKWSQLVRKVRRSEV